MTPDAPDGAKPTPRKSKNGGPKNKGNSLTRTFAIPLILFIIGMVGLLSALTGDGPRDWTSWAALSIPVVIIMWRWLR